MDRGLLIVISGFAGTGKGTIMKKIMSDSTGRFALSVSATTRSPRKGETDGVEYFFKTKEEFEELIRKDELIEYAGYVDNYYGTPKSYVYEQLDSGKDVFLEIEVQGALQVKKKYPDTVLVFVVPPSIEEMKKRLAGRGSETEETTKKRLARAVEEAKLAYEYDYILVNEDVDTAVNDLKTIVAAEHQKTENRKNVLQDLQAELGGLK